MMSLFSWFYSADQLDAVVFGLAIAAVAIEFAVAVGAIIDWGSKNLPKERRKVLERCVAVMALVATLFGVVVILLSQRSSKLHFKEQQAESAASERKIADANERAGSAYKLAGEANREAALANERAATLESTNKVLATQLATIESTNLVLRANVAELDKQVAETKIQLAKASERTALIESNNLVLRKELTAIDPINLPIRLATAEVSFLVFGTNASILPRDTADDELDKMVLRLSFKDPKVGDFPVFLACETITKRKLSPDTLLVRLSFKSQSLGAEWRLSTASTEWDDLSPRKFDEFKQAEIAYALAENTKIIGSCSVILNSTTKRRFEIVSHSKDGIVLRPAFGQYKAPDSKK